MNRKITLFAILITLSVSSLFALTAIVEDHNGNKLQPIVKISQLDTIFSLNTNGVLNFQSTTTVLNTYSMLIQPSFQFSNNHFKFTLNQATNISINLFNVCGQKVMAYEEEIPLVGDHTVPITNLANGVYLYNIKIGTNSLSGKLSINNSQNKQVFSGNSSVKTNFQSRANSIIDTITFTLDGFGKVTKLISSYDEDLGTIIMSKGVLFASDSIYPVYDFTEYEDRLWIDVLNKEIIGSTDFIVGHNSITNALLDSTITFSVIATVPIDPKDTYIYEIDETMGMLRSIHYDAYAPSSMIDDTLLGLEVKDNVFIQEGTQPGSRPESGNSEWFKKGDTLITAVSYKSSSIPENLTYGDFLFYLVPYDGLVPHQSWILVE